MKDYVFVWLLVLGVCGVILGGIWWHFSAPCSMVVPFSNAANLPARCLDNVKK
jgi:hypothetical protein